MFMTICRARLQVLAVGAVRILHSKTAVPFVFIRWADDAPVPAGCPIACTHIAYAAPPNSRDTSTPWCQCLGINRVLRAVCAVPDFRSSTPARPLFFINPFVEWPDDVRERRKAEEHSG